jgi:hypothetical protein
MSSGPGRPRLCSDEVLLRVARLRVAGLSYQAIANRLNALRIPTPQSRRPWSRSHVDRLLHTRDARVLTEKLTVAARPRSPVTHTR